MKVTAKVVQVEEISDLGSVRQAVERALKDVADQCLSDANQTVPLEIGDLQNSGHAEQAGLEAQVAYGTPYAVKQHEDTSLRHDPGRRAQWLELTVYENEGRYSEHVADAARRALS